MDNDPLKKINEYSGNGWSQYQLLVLETLRDHTAMLKEVMSEMNSLKQQNAVLDIINKNWREGYDKNLADIKTDVEQSQKDLVSLDERVDTLEINTKTEEKINLKMKGAWAAIGGGLIVIVELGLKLIEFLYHKFN
jgi:hypothetical protein